MSTSKRTSRSPNPGGSRLQRRGTVILSRSPSPREPVVFQDSWQDPPQQEKLRRSASLPGIDVFKDTTEPPPPPPITVGESIRVVCRFRPVNSKQNSDGGRDATVSVQYDNPTDDICSRVTLISKDAERRHHFTFDRIFLPHTPQETIFQHCGEPIIERVLQGINCTIFAYGQTGAGKTHTMLSPPCDTGDTQINMMTGPQRGLIPRCMEFLFKKIRSLSARDISFIVKVCFVEIYMEKIRDLLGDPTQNLFLQEDTRGVFVAGAVEHVVYRVEDVLALLCKGTAQKVVTSTKMNEDSNRSHGIFMVTVEQRARTTMEVKLGRLHMVDLAGSEKVSKTMAEGQQLDEANKINQSLLYLSMVIKSLTSPDSTNSRHIPYMNSKLTRLLQDSLGGNTLTYIILNCSESSYNIDESLSTLRFGERAKFIRNKPRVNNLPSMMELRLKFEAATKEVDRLKTLLDSKLSEAAELEKWKNTASALTKELQEYTEMTEINMKNYQDDNDSLRKQLRDALDRANKTEMKLKEKDITSTATVIPTVPPTVVSSPVLTDDIQSVHAKLDLLLQRTQSMTSSQPNDGFVMQLQQRYDNVVEQLTLARAETEEMRLRNEQITAQSQRTTKLHAQKVVLLEEQLANVGTAMSVQQRSLTQHVKSSECLVRDLQAEVGTLRMDLKTKDNALCAANVHIENMKEEIRKLKDMANLRQERINFLENLFGPTLEECRSPPPPPPASDSDASTTCTPETKQCYIGTSPEPELTVVASPYQHYN